MRRASRTSAGISLPMGTNRGHELELQIIVAIDSPLRLIGRIRSASLAPYDVHGEGNH